MIERDVKAAEALTFASALIGLGVLSLQALMALPATDLLNLRLTLGLTAVAILFMSYLASRCLIVSIYLSFPWLIRRVEYAARAGCFGLVIMVIILGATVASDKKVTHVHPSGECATILCQTVRPHVQGVPHTPAAPIDPAPSTPPPPPA